MGLDEEEFQRLGNNYSLWDRLYSLAEDKKKIRTIHLEYEGGDSEDEQYAKINSSDGYENSDRTVGRLVRLAEESGYTGFNWGNAFVFTRNIPEKYGGLFYDFVGHHEVRESYHSYENAALQQEHQMRMREKYGEPPPGFEGIDIESLAQRYACNDELMLVFTHGADISREYAEWIIEDFDSNDPTAYFNMAYPKFWNRKDRTQQDPSAVLVEFFVNITPRLRLNDLKQWYPWINELNLDEEDLKYFLYLD